LTSRDDDVGCKTLARVESRHGDAQRLGLERMTLPTPHNAAVNNAFANES
jgi:hypothetical protein